MKFADSTEHENDWDCAKEPAPIEASPQLDMAATNEKESAENEKRTKEEQPKSQPKPTDVRGGGDGPVEGQTGAKEEGEKETITPNAASPRKEGAAFGGSQES